MLTPFSDAEKEVLSEVFEKIEKAIMLIVQKGKTAAMNEINSVG